MSAREVADLMTVCLARCVVPGDVIGVGLGTPIALVAAVVARELHADVHALAGGAFDVEGAADVWLGSRDDTAGKVVGYVSHLDSMEMAERQAMTLQFLRPAQVDSHGNLNTSRIGTRAAPQVRFPGGLATADVPSILPRVVAYLPKHEARNLPESVSYVTGSGRGRPDEHDAAAGVVTVVTDLGVIDFDRGEARLRSVHPWSTLAEIEECTGYSLRVDAEPATTPPATGDEAAALARVDPNRFRDGELAGRSSRPVSEV